MASVLKVDTIKSLTGNEAMTITESGVPLLQVPAFQVVKSANQNISSSTYTVIANDGVLLDTHGWYSNSTYRYTPQIEGWYFFSAYYSGRATSPTRRILTLSKTGALSYNIFDTSETGVYAALNGGALIYLNGTTDYVDAQAYMIGTSPYIGGSRFEGFLVRAA